MATSPVTVSVFAKVGASHQGDIPMPTNTVWKVATVLTYQGQECVLTSHYRQLGPNTSSETDADSLAAAYAEDVLPALLDCMTTEATVNTIEVRQFVPAGSPMTGNDLPISPVAPGTIAPPGMPPSVAILLQRGTAFLGRKARGRQYVPATPVAEQEGALVTSAFAGGPMLDYGNTLKADITHTGVSGAPSFRPVVAALDPTIVTPVPGVRTTDITKVKVDRVYRSQRRRQPATAV